MSLETDVTSNVAGYKDGLDKINPRTTHGDVQYKFPSSSPRLKYGRLTNQPIAPKVPKQINARFLSCD
jgi:hypothetical protein